MSCYVVSYVQGAKVMRPVRNTEEYRSLRDSERQRRTVAAIRDGSQPREETARLKRQLVQMSYSCIPAADGRLKGVRTASASVGMDIDFNSGDPDYGRKMAEVPQRVMARKDEIGLLMLERSASKGYHIVFRRRFTDGLDEGRVLENQVRNLRWASEVLGVEFDEGAKDITRVFFTTTASEEDLLYLSDDLFDDTEAAKPAETVGAKPAETVSRKKETVGGHPAEEEPGEYMGFAFEDIISKYMEMFNDGKNPSEGDRNVKTYELALTLRSICDYSQERLERVIPRYDNFPEEEWRTTIANALKEPRRSMPYRLTQVLKELRGERKLRLLSGNRNPGEDGMPQRPRRMPAMLRLLSSKVPARYKPMVEEAVWPAICAHLHGVTFRYIDGVIHEANISSPLIGRQSVGKGNVNKPIEYLLADITERDRQNEMRERQWRMCNQGKSSSKDKQPRPADLVFQRLDDDLTPAALAQALIDAERNGQRRIITKVDEIEMLGQVGNGKSSMVGLLVRYGFDSARWGQKRVGLESVNGTYTVRWVWNASCTLKSARRFISRNWIANGSLSRLNVNTIIVPEGNKEIERIGDYDAEYEQAVGVFVSRLNAASGLVECRQADRLAYKMLEEHNRIADLCESEGYRVFSYRAVLIGWLKANILFIANGCKWDTAIADYVAYSVRRDLWVKFYYFGQLIEEEFEEEESQHSSGPCNMLELLPREFSYSDFASLRMSQGRKGDGKSTLRTWMSRGYIALDSVTGRYIRK